MRSSLAPSCSWCSILVAAHRHALFRALAPHASHNNQAEPRDYSASIVRTRGPHNTRLGQFWSLRLIPSSSAATQWLAAFNHPFSSSLPLSDNVGAERPSGCLCHPAASLGHVRLELPAWTQPFPSFFPNGVKAMTSPRFVVGATRDKLAWLFYSLDMAVNRCRRHEGACSSLDGPVKRPMGPQLSFSATRGSAGHATGAAFYL
jgi:hypothetical protein